MKIIVGLGNPGKEYEKTRHNVGFIVVEAIAKKLSIINPPAGRAGYQSSNNFNAEIVKMGEALLVKPQGFMNRSGEVVSRIVNFYKIPASDLWVAHDDLDIKLGEYKIQFGKGPRVHNGVSSVEQTLGTKEFWRIRIGIDNGLPRESGEEYVLGKFNQEEKMIIDAVIEKVVDEIVSANIRNSQTNP